MYAYITQKKIFLYEKSGFYMKHPKTESLLFIDGGATVRYCSLHSQSIEI